MTLRRSEYSTETSRVKKKVWVESVVDVVLLEGLREGVSILVSCSRRKFLEAWNTYKDRKRNLGLHNTKTDKVDSSQMKGERFGLSR